MQLSPFSLLLPPQLYCICHGLILCSLLGIRLHAQRGDVVMFNHLKGLIENPHLPRPQNNSQYSSLTSSMSPAAIPTPPSYLGVPPTGGYKMAPTMNNYRPGGVATYLEFKPSPFYTLQQQIGETEECQGEPKLLSWGVQS